MTTEQTPSKTVNIVLVLFSGILLLWFQFIWIDGNSFYYAVDMFKKRKRYNIEWCPDEITTTYKFYLLPFWENTVPGSE